MNLSKQLHPAIYAKLDELERHALSDLATSGDDGARRREVWRKHQAIWNRTYGRSFLGQLGVVAGLLAGSSAFAAASPWVVADMAVIASGVTGVVLMSRFIQKNRRSVTGEELENLISLLSLSAMEQLYCDAMVALAEMRHIPEHETTAIAAQLNRLLDSSVHLTDRRQLLEQATREPPSTIEAEARALALKLTGAEDPLVREAIGKSLALCEERLRSRHELETVRARLEAQSEMVAQSFKRLKESLTRLKLARAALQEPDLAGALQAIADVNAFTAAFEAGDPVSVAPLAPVPAVAAVAAVAPVAAVAEDAPRAPVVRIVG